MLPRFGKRDDDTWIEDAGRVVRLLNSESDDRHQRFVIRLAGGQTLLIAHNLELGGRVPIGLGDRIRFRGVYEWNDMGGLVHWTHRDPAGGDDSGWIRLRRDTYR